MKYLIEKDPYIGKYILWEKHKNYEVDLFHGLKKDCLKLKKELEAKNKNVQMS